MNPYILHKKVRQIPVISNIHSMIFVVSYSPSCSNTNQELLGCSVIILSQYYYFPNSLCLIPARSHIAYRDISTYRGLHLLYIGQPNHSASQRKKNYHLLTMFWLHFVSNSISWYIRGNILILLHTVSLICIISSCNHHN